MATDAEMAITPGDVMTTVPWAVGTIYPVGTFVCFLTLWRPALPFALSRCEYAAHWACHAHGLCMCPAEMMDRLTIDA